MEGNNIFHRPIREQRSRGDRSGKKKKDEDAQFGLPNKKGGKLGLRVMRREWGEKKTGIRY